MKSILAYLAWFNAVSACVVATALGLVVAGCSASTADGDASGSIGPATTTPSPGHSAPTSNTGAPTSNTGDQHENVGTNPFVLTAHDPLSTFAVDVDSASYDIFRRDINLGQLPVPDSVRLEEYVNSFHYDYPAPTYDAKVPFSISLAAGPSFFDRNSVTLRVGIQGKMSPPDQRKPANIVFLVDTSGSMQSPDKLPLVKEVLTHGLSVLQPSDTVAIVTYAGATRVALKPTPVAESKVILSTLESLEAGGSTAGAAGLDLAYQEAQAGFLENGINHVVLCTDGDFNVGPSTTDELVALIKEKRSSGITLTVLGFGVGNLNDAMMERVSDSGDGIYSVISNAEQADRYAEDSLLSSLVHIAKDVKIQVELNPTRVLAYRLLGYEDRALADDQFRDDAVDAGEIGSGHRVTALYELILQGEVPVVPGAPEAIDGEPYTGSLEVDPNDLALVKVRYKDVDATDEDPAYEVSAALAPKSVASNAEDLDADFQWASSVATFAEILKESPFAKPSLLPRIQRAIANPAHDNYADRLEFRELFGKATTLIQKP